MMVLFLGGPWHDQRHDVTPTRLSAGRLPLHFAVPTFDGVRPRHVNYTRRYVRSAGDRFPVYVSADYQGPARA
ncbi:hypothetical protein DFJ67_6034 [Asanoa ferruginea]|jgi:hypothetical protein|uniref:Uncharacterized protein n=1 Tax=Asanoa ferruginea TaxID=53367 RepID=A0A3D9ZS78_9ACTN|nr:hypothetical protein [Asanoa ferruginea]REF99987.1 hypothetical protein DFJ67_6034 [Asanoa ferruginea]GIF51726.1 hypothetical protein Afe04nite_62650 [Asanoa ferruginea]HEV7712614.1 hypothetical protein [Asanoa sp.]HTF08391.1 hypothetical protein [Asanoa sp.]